MRRLLPLGILLLLALIAALVLWRTWPAPVPPGTAAPLGRRNPRREAAEGYARATAIRPFVFPQDHGPHPDFRTEWWYFTGNLEDAAGRHFGYQLTFFRVALAPQMPERSSAWATRQIYMAHFALTDAAGNRFYNFERFSRAALGLAGAQTEPFRVWLEDWSVARTGEGETAFPLRLRAAAGEVGVDLRLQPGKPIVLQGDRGLSRKSGEEGNASYYYSLTRMPTAGVLRIGTEELPVQGALLARPGMEHQRPGSRGDRLGLVCPAALRRPRDHVLPSAPGGRQRFPLERRHAGCGGRDDPAPGAGGGGNRGTQPLDQSAQQSGLPSALAVAHPFCRNRSAD